MRLLFDLCLELDKQTARGERPNVVVIGGGVTGTELACCFHSRVTRQAARAEWLWWVGTG